MNGIEITADSAGNIKINTKHLYTAKHPCLKKQGLIYIKWKNRRLIAIITLIYQQSYFFLLKYSDPKAYQIAPELLLKIYC